MQDSAAEASNSYILTLLCIRLTVYYRHLFKVLTLVYFTEYSLCIDQLVPVQAEQADPKQQTVATIPELSCSKPGTHQSCEGDLSPPTQPEVCQSHDKLPMQTETSTAEHGGPGLQPEDPEASDPPQASDRLPPAPSGAAGVFPLPTKQGKQPADCAPDADMAQSKRARIDKEAGDRPDGLDGSPYGVANPKGISDALVCASLDPITCCSKSFKTCTYPCQNAII